MTRNVLYILAVLTLCLVAGCHQAIPYPLAMQQAEYLMNTHPDSAFKILQDMKDTIPVAKIVMLFISFSQFWHTIFKPILS